MGHWDKAERIVSSGKKNWSAICVESPEILKRGLFNPESYAPEGAIEPEVINIRVPTHPDMFVPPMKLEVVFLIVHGCAYYRQ